MTEDAKDDEGDLVPVLQIVHVTDLHVKHTTANAASPLASKTRILARIAQNLVRRRNLLGWEEGTQGHLPRAPKAFATFLEKWWTARDAQWQRVPVWLVDTGDRTAFGDAESISAGARYIDWWSAALGGCPVRTLYGNHDMWPETLPAFNLTQIKDQRDRIRAIPGWDVRDWVRNPLSAPIPGHSATISLYALDTIAWGALWGSVRNTRAVGHLRGDEVLHLRLLLEGAAKRGTTGLRILAMHHPLAFPWEASELGGKIISKLKLLKEEKWAAFLRNDRNIPSGIGPWAHLLLSGHTHLFHPAPGLPQDVTEITQGALSAYQLQLVGGSLMLNRSSSQRNEGAVPPASTRSNVKGFFPATVDPHPCQAQILRFYASADREEPWVKMMRMPVYCDDAGRHYVMRDPDATTLYFQLP
jgi:hypothetical protein